MTFHVSGAITEFLKVKEKFKFLIMLIFGQTITFKPYFVKQTCADVLSVLV